MSYVYCSLLEPKTVESQVTRIESQGCISPPVQYFNEISVSEGAMTGFQFPVCRGFRYLACTQNPKGNPDIYGGSTPPTLSTYEEKSTDMMMADGVTPKPDCINFEPDNDEIHFIGIYGAAPNTKTNVWVSSSNKNRTPPGFQNSLRWVSYVCLNKTTPKYGPMNTPWGNDGDPDRPFYSDYLNYIHGGIDVSCPAYSPVQAMCDGRIVSSKSAGGRWGWNTVLECYKEANTISIAYIHLNKESILKAGTQVTKGQVVGTIYPLQVPGEIDHVHLTACNRSYGECDLGGYNPERGAVKVSEWPEASKYWFDLDWYSNPSLYDAPPGIDI